MKFGFISDIHGNYNGLRITLAHLKGMGCEILCLGDLISESSDENEQCIKLIKKLNIQTVKGQHDDTCVKVNSPQVSQESRDFLQDMPEIISREDIICVHDNPLEKARTGQGMWRSGSYIRSQLEADVVFSEFFNNTPDIRLVFFGHTHLPAIFTDNEGIHIEYGQTIHLSEGKRYLINPGSIGGTQIGAQYHTYLSYDQEEDLIEFYRVEKEGTAFVKQSLSERKVKLNFPAQKLWFKPF